MRRTTRSMLMIRKISTFRRGRAELPFLVVRISAILLSTQLGTDLLTYVAIHQFVFHGIMGQFRIRFHFELFQDAGAVGADGSIRPSVRQARPKFSSAPASTEPMPQPANATPIAKTPLPIGRRCAPIAPATATAPPVLRQSISRWTARYARATRSPPLAGSPPIPAYGSVTTRTRISRRFRRRPSRRSRCPRATEQFHETGPAAARIDGTGIMLADSSFEKN